MHWTMPHRVLLNLTIRNLHPVIPARFSEKCKTWSTVATQKWCFLDQIWFGLVWFHGISTIVGYLMPNPVFTYILNIWFVKIFCIYSQLNDQTVLFTAIQFRTPQQSWILKVLPYISNNSIKHHSFVYTQLNDQTVVYQAVQFSTNHFFALRLNVKQFYF